MTTQRPSFTDQEALDFHSHPTAGKISMIPTKPMSTQRDLSLAYSPGVAVPVLAIAGNEDLAYDYTSKGNLVAVISNGTAILGLGNLGPMASKPVMEGKAVLFKRFADIDSFDIEVNTTDAEDFIRTVRNIGATWGGINLEDISAPDCFIIESRLREELDIPVFHDDQTAPRSSPLPALSTPASSPGASCPTSGLPSLARAQRASRSQASSAISASRVRTSCSAIPRAWFMKAAPRRWTSSSLPSRSRPGNAPFPKRWRGRTSSSACRSRAP